MKLIRFGPAGSERPGIIDADGTARDASGVVSDYTPDVVGPELIQKLGADVSSLPEITPERLGPPLARVGHFIAIGLNFADHAAESGAPVPAEPILFSKAPNTVTGPNDRIELPPDSEKSDWEVELAFVVGKRAERVSQPQALDHVFGYMICNDVSERAWQLEGTGQWMKGKSAPTFAPLGPWLVTADDVPDPQVLDMSLDVNGERMQTGSTRTMIFGVAELVSYLSHKMVLEPGDVVTTGTPPGVGMAMDPPRFLKEGDTVRLEIAGLGVQETPVVRRG